MARSELGSRVQSYTLVGGRIMDFIYNDCSRIFGLEQWELMVKSTRSSSSYKLPMGLYRPAAEAMYEQSKSSPSSISALVNDLKFVVRLRKGQATYYMRKPNKTREEVDSCETHAHFINILEYVLERMVELRIRRNVEDTRTEINRTNIKVSPQVEVNLPSMEESINTFYKAAKEEKQTPDQDPLLQQIRDDLGAEYAFYLAIYKIDVEGLRSECKMF